MREREMCIRDRAKAYEMVMSGEIKDGKTIAGVLKLKALVDEGRL